MSFSCAASRLATTCPSQARHGAESSSGTATSQRAHRVGGQPPPLELGAAARCSARLNTVRTTPPRESALRTRKRTGSDPADGVTSLIGPPFAVPTKKSPAARRRFAPHAVCHPTQCGAPQVASVPNRTGGSVHATLSRPPGSPRVARPRDRGSSSGSRPMSSDRRRGSLVERGRTCIFVAASRRAFKPKPREASPCRTSCSRSAISPDDGPGA